MSTARPRAGSGDASPSTGGLLGAWLERTSGRPLVGRTWALSDPLDRGSRFVEGSPGPSFTVVGEPRIGGQAAVARAVVGAGGERVALRVMLASTDPRAQQRERLQVAVGQLSMSHAAALPALVQTFSSLHLSVPAAEFYVSDGRGVQPGGATVEIWAHVMQWCPGTLADDLAAAGGRGLGAEQTVRRLLPVIRTLIGMHELGYIHRDLDPSNIVVAEDGSLRVADFGIAVHMKIESTHTMTEAWGKPGRMPPEALYGTYVPVGPAYDAWQVGFLLGETATGTRPFTPGGGFAPQVAELPGDVAAVVRGLLDADRERRLGLPAAAERLARYLGSTEVSDRHRPSHLALSGSASGPPSPPRRNRALLRAWRSVLAGCLVLGLAGGAAVIPAGDAQASQITVRSLALAVAEQDLVRSLQDERGVTAASLGGNPSFAAEIPAARGRVGTQTTIVRNLAAAVKNDPQGASALSATRSLAGLSTLRTKVDSGRQNRRAAFDEFTTLIAGFSRIDLGDETTDARLSRDVSAWRSVQDMIESTSQERAFMTGVFSAGGFRTGEYARFEQMRAEKTNAETQFGTLAVAADKTSLKFVSSTGAASTTRAFEQIAVDAADGHHIVVNPQTYWSAQTTVLDDLGQLLRHLASQAQIRAYRLHRRAQILLAGAVGLAIPGLAAVASVTWARRRRIPDRSLRPESVVRVAPQVEDPETQPGRGRAPTGRHGA